MLWLLLSFILFSPSVPGAQPGPVRKEVVSECGDYQLKIVSLELNRNIPEQSILDESAGHFGNPYLLTQELVYISKAGVTTHSISNVWPEYERIDPTRYYSATIKQCTDKREAIIAFWSGGNCRDVCEAWALVTFTEDGTIESSKGLSYQEFKLFN
ncbi:hypothetical protein HUZ36_17650 [Pseudoalteromonas sp. McH1-7]|uniref:hypothetical protein n=1 Tax=Pseudoalteromonas TaxID=53246 RepID=UPI00158FCC7B|nr:MULTISPECIES: hypothetical protein [Pseudoalteromonas]MDW7549033.1 hypothetical protein [Pseudoalteromonas peptidolytica]NUZ12609.1 hypothetical protein [Pseudoalteromonas sp. McH1-7]USD30268.1 hypothetical protein J8Z24_19225 [Pseudoalteromonas sp. SCSIO 43201]